MRLIHNEYLEVIGALYAIYKVFFDLGSPLTHQRDVQAIKELKKHITLADNWKEQYYNEQEAFIFENPVKAITDDTKIQKVPALPEPLVIGQIELWNGSSFLNEHIDSIRESLSQHESPFWFINIPSIKEKKNYIYSENKQVQEALESAINAKFVDGLFVSDKLILRKEILKALYTT